VPLTNLVIETDGPWPYGGEFEGQLTEPAFLGRLIEEIATIKGVATNDVEDRVTYNSRALFRLGEQ